MKKLTAIVLTLVLLLSLTGCEETISKLLYQRDKDDTVQAQEPQVPNTTPSIDDTPAQTVDPTTPAEPSEPDVSAPAPDEAPAEEEKNDKEQDTGITASHSDVSLFHAGEKFKFVPQNVSGIYACTYASADETIATVDSKTGEITAVAPGITTVSMHLECSEGQFDFPCIVRCRWTPEEPELSEPAPGGTEPSSGGTTPSSSKASLSGFVSTLQGKYDGLSGMMVLDSQLLENYYPGLSGIASVEEVLIEESAISINNKAVGLVRLSDSATSEDILKVQSILQSRINSQADGGAFYLDACDVWKNGVITSVSNCVGMFVYPDEAHSMATLFADTFGS